MSIVVQISLLEALHCFYCYSTSDDDVGKNADEKIIEIGDSELKVIRLHDGKGGIKNFQTKDIDFTLGSYKFPFYLAMDQFIPTESPLTHNIEDRTLERSIELIETCNKCDFLWEGHLTFEFDSQDNIYISKRIELPYIGRDIRHDEFEQENDFYKILFSQNKIVITPKIDSAIEYYQAKSKEFKSKREIYGVFLGTIKNNDKIHSILEQVLINVPEEVRYVNELAKSIQSYNRELYLLEYTNSALIASLILLHHTNKSEALNIVDQMGMSVNDFMKSVKNHKWVFEQKSGEHDLSESFGIITGPNFFLTQLKAKE